LGGTLRIEGRAETSLRPDSTRPRPALEDARARLAPSRSPGTPSALKAATFFPDSRIPMSKVLLVLGDGPVAPFALAWAREAGLETLFLAPSASPARRLAHEFHPLDIGESAPALALVRRLSSGRHLRGVLAASRRALPLLAQLAEAAPEVLSSRRAHQHAASLPRELLAPAGIATAAEDAQAPHFDVLASLRDGQLARGCVVERAPEIELAYLPAALAPAETLALEQRTALAVQALGLTQGPVQATWQRSSDGFALIEVLPTWLASHALTHGARLAHGKSPLQAWCAHLADAGGPFDEVPARTRAAIGLATLAGRLPEELGDLGPVRRLAGVLELVRECTSENPRRPTRLTLVVEGRDRSELEHRLRRARAALEERIACKRTA
jgi:hypothetical protein